MEKTTGLRVVHIIGGGEIGGAEQHVLRLAARLPQAGFEARVICLFPAPFYQVLQEAGIPAHVVPMRHRLDFRALLRLTGLLRELRPQILHTHGVRANLVGRLAARRAGVPVVVTTVHSVLAHDYPAFFSRLANSITERGTSFLTDRFIAVSRFIKDYLLAAGVPPAKVAVIYNGIEPGAWQRWAGDASFRLRWGIDPAAPLFGIVARLHPVKGHRYFLEAAREVAARFPEARFVVVGSGFFWREVDALIRACGLEGRCIRTGFQQEIGPVYAALDCLVVSSLSEGFGLTALEALALGKPVIATRVGALPEVIADGETGLLVPPADSAALARAMCRILEDAAGARRLGEAGRRLVEEKFSLAQTVAETARLYRSLLAPCP
ncbi:MAG: glycosyltransferase [Firmicutes bacterium]|nr:glycosyltransferase [Bacillota bacterium]